MTTRDQGLVHVAGIIDMAEADMLIDCGVAYLGFPLALDHHEEDLSIQDAAAIVAECGGRATFFLITYLNTASAVIDLCRELGVGMVQLHGDIDPSELTRLREAAAPLRVIKSLIVRNDNADALADEMRRLAPLVDAFITDTFDPATGARGATGKTHDWSVSRDLVERSSRPVILAGGLNAGNVRQAIGTVRPAGVDVHTGVEGPDGRKRHDLTERFVAEARSGFADIS
ncbi:MAG: phosphoribosylanthranilate isomerase [Hyphomicrobiales bacterium]